MRESDFVPHQHQWVADGSGLLTGANYIGAVKVWGNLLLSAVLAARGRPLQASSVALVGDPVH